MAIKLSDNERVLAYVFGLTLREVRVFQTVQKNPVGISVSEVSRKTKISRTTVGYILRGLAKRKLIGRSGTIARPLYSALTVDEMDDKLDCLRTSWLPAGKGSHQPLRAISTHVGGVALYALWQEISSLPMYTRVRGIQPDASFVLALEHIHGQVPHEEIIEINRAIGRRKIIMEMVVHEQSVDSIAEVLKKQGESPLPFLETFRQRPADSAKLPEDFLNIPVEMYIFNDVAIIMYWPEEYAVRIKNQAIADFLRGMFEAVKYLSDRYNQNEKVAKKIVELAMNDQA